MLNTHFFVVYSLCKHSVGQVDKNSVSRADKNYPLLLHPYRILNNIGAIRANMKRLIIEMSKEELSTFHACLDAAICLFVILFLSKVTIGFLVPPILHATIAYHVSYFTFFPWSRTQIVQGTYLFIRIRSVSFGRPIEWKLFALLAHRLYAVLRTAN